MNPQPNSHSHPEVIEAMKSLDMAVRSLDEFRKTRKDPIEDIGTVAYENSLIRNIRDSRASLDEWCKHYAIEMSFDSEPPAYVGFNENIRTGEMPN